MSVLLKTQIRDYYGYVDEQQGPVDITAIRERQVGERLARPVQLSTVTHRAGRRRLWVPVAAVVAIVLLVGGVAWLLRDAPDNVIDQIPTTIVTPVTGADGVLGPGAWSVAATFTDPGVTPEVMASTADLVRTWPGVLEVVEVPDAAAWRQLTGVTSDCGAGDITPPCGAGLVALTVDSSMDQTVIRLEREFGMIALTPRDVLAAFSDGYLDAAMRSASPVPLDFDPSSLGVEQPLRGPFSDWEPEDSVCGGFGPCDVGVEVEVDGVVARVGIVVTESGLESGLGSAEDLLVDRFGRGGVLASLRRVVERRRVYEFAALPLEAAVVVFEQADGSTVWQRPLAGMSVIVDRRGSGSGSDHGWIDDDRRLAGPFVVLNAGGTEILRIRDTPDGPLIEDLRLERAPAASATPPENSPAAGESELTIVATVDGMPIRTRLGGDLVEAGDAVWLVTYEERDGYVVIRVDPTSGVVETIPMDGSVSKMVSTAEALWVNAMFDNGSVSRIDLASRTITDTIQVPFSSGHSGDIIVADGGLWVTGSQTGFIRIDLATHATETYPGVATLGDWVGEIDGGLWAVDDRAGQGLTRIDLGTRQSEHYDVAFDPSPEMNLVIADDAIWFVDCCDGEVARLGLELLEITHELNLGWSLGAGVFAQGAVWLPADPGTIIRIDAATAEVTDVITVEPNSYDMSLFDDSIWVLGQDAVSRIDLTTRQVTEVIAASSGRMLVATDSAVWIATDDGTITRITTAP